MDFLKGANKLKCIIGEVGGVVGATLEGMGHHIL